jgi:branched-chain amino acid transport system substrate-binding protein
MTDTRFNRRRENGALLANLARFNCILPLLAAMFCAQPALAQPSKLKIGISVPLSGTAAGIARQFVAGARLAVRELAPNGEVELVIADDGCDEDLGQLAGQDLMASNVAIVTGLLCNGAARAVAEEMFPSRIPVIAAGARSNQLMIDAANEGWNLWRLAPGDDFAAQATFRILSGRWQDLPMGLVDDGTIYGRTLSDELGALLQEAGRPVQFTDTIRPAQSTHASMIRRMRQSGVSAVFVAASAEDIALIWESARELKAGFEVAGGETLALLPWQEDAGRTADGLLAIIQPQPEDLPAYDLLSRQMKNANIEPEANVFLGYAAIELSMAALRRTPEETTKALDETVFRTVLGNIDFDAQRRNRVNNYALYEWRGGKFHLVDTETE